MEKKEADWDFWVGRELQIKTLADAVGFRYAYDPRAKQFAHPAVSFFISGDGIISRYLYGLTYSARDIKFSLIETTQGRVGSPVEKLIMSCFSYDTTSENTPQPHLELCDWVVSFHWWGLRSFFVDHVAT